MKSLILLLLLFWFAEGVHAVKSATATLQAPHCDHICGRTKTNREYHSH